MLKFLKNISNNFEEIPTLNWNDNFITSCDYIDGINIYNMSHPIMKGYDNNNRFFISFKLHVYEKRNHFQIVNTIFQRYSDCDKTWVLGSPYHFSFHNSLINSDILNQYSKIISEGEIIYRGDTRICLSK